MGAGIILAVFFVVVVAAVLGRMGLALIESWHDYRLRLALLKQLERNPDIAGSAEPIEALLRDRSKGRGRQDYVLTGLFVAGIGVFCVVAGRLLRTGQGAVGLYVGGWACLWVGMVLSLLGIVIRLLVRNRRKKVPPGS